MNHEIFSLFFVSLCLFISYSIHSLSGSVGWFYFVVFFVLHTGETQNGVFFSAKIQNIFVGDLEYSLYSNISLRIGMQISRTDFIEVLYIDYRYLRGKYE